MGITQSIEKKNNETRNWLFEMINKMDKTSERVTKKKKEDSNYQN